MDDLISRQIVLNEFCHSCDGWSCNPNTCCKTEWIRKLPVIQPEPHWIPVTEGLPEKFDYYLVSDINSVWFARYESGRFLGILSGHVLDTVIAWMPLPESFKGVTE